MVVGVSARWLPWLVPSTAAETRAGLDHPVIDADGRARSGLSSPVDIRATFARQCFFGCEADDATWALPFTHDHALARWGPKLFADTVVARA